MTDSGASTGAADFAELAASLPLNMDCLVRPELSVSSRGKFVCQMIPLYAY